MARPATGIKPSGRESNAWDLGRPALTLRGFARMVRPMKIRLLSLLAIVASLGLSPVCTADSKPETKAKPAEKEQAEEKKAEKSKAPLPDYIRYAETPEAIKLEIAVKTFEMPTGQKVDLMGVVHIADKEYYNSINKRFDGYDAVLFELVGDPEWLTKNAPPSDDQQKKRPGGGAISAVQGMMGKYLKLTFQLGAIDYTKPNMVHADASAEEFEKMQEERGESMMTLFMRAMKAQLTGEIDTTEIAGELDTFGLIRILMSKDSAAEFKKILAKMFDQAESMTAILEGPAGSAILSGRNDVVMKKIKEVLGDDKKKRIAVFYGAAHMPGIEGLLLKDFKAKAAGEEWMAAWTMPVEQAKKEEPAKKEGAEEKKP